MRYSFLAIAVSSCVIGCTNLPEREEHYEKVNGAIQTVERLRDTPKVIVSDKPYVDVTPIYRELDKHQWLKDIKGIEIAESKNAGAIPLYEIIRLFKEEGVNIASSLPLERYPYRGFKLSSTDAFTALEIITSSIGIDFDVFDGDGNSSPYVRLTPMKAVNYKLDVENREIEFSISDDSFSGGELSFGSQSDSGSSQESEGSEGEEEKTSISIKSNFYKNLEKELVSMMVRSVPITREVEQGNGMSSMQSNSFNRIGSEILEEIAVGKISVNVDTGNIMIQAPKHIREEIIEYLNVLDTELNTSIHIEGRIVVVNESEGQSKGLDINSLVEFGEDYGLVISNDVFDQVSITRPADGTFSAVADGAFGSLMGVTASDGLLDVFSAYVESTSNITSVLEPRINTSSGSPGSFSRSRPYYLNNISGSTTQGESSSTTSSSNDIQIIEFGSSLRVLPVYNSDRDTIRAQIDLTHVVQNGTQELTQIITSDTGTEQTVTRIPVPEKITIQGEIVAQNGALTIMGGETLEIVEQYGQGVTEVRESYVGGLFGSSDESVQRNKYYFVVYAKATSFEEALVKARQKSGS